MDHRFSLVNTDCIPLASGPWIFLVAFFEEWGKPTKIMSSTQYALLNYNYTHTRTSIDVTASLPTCISYILIINFNAIRREGHLLPGNSKHGT